MDKEAKKKKSSVMEESKCGKIPPCYGGKKFRIHEELEEIKPCSEETAQGIIEAYRRERPSPSRLL